MISQSKAISILWKIINESEISSAITGHIYKLEKPIDSDKEDGVIKPLAFVNGEVQEGIILFNLYVKDKIMRKGNISHTLPDTWRIEELDELIMTVLGSTIYPEGQDCNFEIEPANLFKETEGTTRDNVGFHYLSYRVRFYNVR